MLDHDTLCDKLSDTILCGEWRKFSSNQVSITDSFSNEVIPNAKWTDTSVLIFLTYITNIYHKIVYFIFIGFYVEQQNEQPFHSAGKENSMIKKKQKESKQTTRWS
jgi:hypothetical protein